MRGTPYLYVAQNGTTAIARTVRELCEQFGYAAGSARIIYRDKKDGRTVKVGYVVGPLWFTRYTPHEI